VRVVEPLGPHTLVTTEVDGAVFRAVLDSNVLPNPGDRLAFAPAPDRIRWFDPDTQEALA
jgi:multiple sugar transport system ATP-binding protein